jgi:hypothetical protein
MRWRSVQGLRPLKILDIQINIVGGVLTRQRQSGVEECPCEGDGPRPVLDSVGKGAHFVVWGPVSAMRANPEEGLQVREEIALVPVEAEVSEYSKESAGAMAGVAVG